MIALLLASSFTISPITIFGGLYPAWKCIKAGYSGWSSFYRTF